MSSLEADKEELISRFRSVNDLRVIKAIRALLDEAVPKTAKVPLSSVFGSISDAEANELVRIIRDGCENVDDSQW